MDEAGRRSHEHRVVAALGRAALEAGDVAAFLDRAMVEVASTFQADACGLLELGCNGTQDFCVRAARGWREPIPLGSVIPGTSRSHAGFTLASRKPVIFHELARETRFEPAPSLRADGIASGVSVVVPGRERPFGVLGVYSRTPHAFSDDDAALLESIANLLATAIMKKRDDEELRRSNALLEAVTNDVGSSRVDLQACKLEYSIVSPK